MIGDGGIDGKHSNGSRKERPDASVESQGGGKRSKAAAGDFIPRAHNQITELIDPVAVDMRSDTVTKPTPEMRKAMSECVVGDDVFGDDPSVIELEKSAARIFDKAAAIFVPSGTMANLIAIMAHCQERGCEVILGSQNHIMVYEQGGIASIAGVAARTIPTQVDPGSDTPVGGISISAIEEAVRAVDVHFPSSRLVCLENTHNLCGGSPLPVEYVDRVGALCQAKGLKLHIDGARIYNAATAMGVDVSRLCRAADTVSVCLSKGLAAPVGSVLIGPEDFIARARRHRKVLGGGMRQSGALAVCGLLSLSTMSKRLAQDHVNAMRLAVGLASISGIVMVPERVKTNIVYFGVEGGGAVKIVGKLKEKGVLMIAKDDTTIRAVLHYMITSEAVDRVIKCVGEVMSTVKRA